MDDLDEFYLDIQNDGSGLFLRSDILYLKIGDKKIFKNPFQGLRPFRTSEHIFFCGRDEQTQGLIACLQKHKFLAVIGSSGTGKSSLVRAGLIPALFRDDLLKVGTQWDIAICRPGDNPIKNLAASLAATKLIGERSDKTNPYDIKKVGEAEKIRAGRVNAENALYNSAYGILDFYEILNPAPRKNNLLIVVDQFEELFRFESSNIEVTINRPESESETVSFSKEELKEHFVNLLLKSAPVNRESGLPIYIVITMRSEFLGDCIKFNQLPEAINKGQYLVPRLTDDQLRIAIRSPLELVNKKISNALAERLVNETENLAAQGSSDQLPLLQHALMRIYEKGKRDGDTLEEKHYDNKEGMKMELSNHADEIYNTLLRENEPLAKIAEIVFQTITDSISGLKGGRRPLAFNLVCLIAKPGNRDKNGDATDEAMKEVAAAIQCFRNDDVSFIVPPSSITLQRPTILDISHESLMRNWKRLDKWIQDEEKYGAYYKMLNDRRILWDESKKQGKGTEWLSEFFLEEMIGWKASHRNCVEWAFRYHTSGSKSNQKQTEMDEEIYKLNLDFLNESIKTSEKKKEDESRAIENKIRVKYLATATAILALAVVIFYFSWNRSELDRFRLEYLQSQLKWTHFLDSVEQKSFVRNGISRNLTTKVDKSVVRSFMLLAEAKAQAERDPDLALRLALKSREQKNNHLAADWVNRKIGHYQYKRKFVVRDAIADVEYDPIDPSRINLLASTRYYSAPALKAGNGHVPINLIELHFVTKPINKQLRYFGPDGRYLLEFDPKTKAVRRIERAQPNKIKILPNGNLIKNLCDPENVKMEISKEGSTLITIESTGIDKSVVRLFDFETGNELKGGLTINDKIIFIPFFIYPDAKIDSERQAALFGDNQLFVFDNRNWKSISTPLDSSKSGIRSNSWTRNDSARMHVISYSYGVYLIGYDEIFSDKMKSFDDCKTKFQIDSKGMLNKTPENLRSESRIVFRIINAAISSSGKYLAYLVQEGQAVTLRIKNLDEIEPDKVIVWPSHAPQRIKAGPGDLFVTAGTIQDGSSISTQLQPDDKNKLWYAYEWDAAHLDTVNFDILVKTENFLRPFTFSERVLYGFHNGAATSRQETLGLAELYHNLYHNDNSPVFSHHPDGARNSREQNDAIDYKLLKDAFHHFDEYFKSTRDTLGSASSLKYYIETGLELDKIQFKPTDSDRPKEGFYARAMKRTEEIGRSLREKNAPESMNNFGAALKAVMQIVDKTEQDRIDALLKHQSSSLAPPVGTR